LRLVRNEVTTWSRGTLRTDARCGRHIHGRRIHNKYPYVVGRSPKCRPKPFPTYANTIYLSE
jgi:hypothetical protein